MLTCALTGLAGVAVASCGRDVREPSIAFTYNWGDPAFERFLQQRLDDTRPAGGDSIRLRVTTEGGWGKYGSSPLVAEVGRATAIAADSSVVAVVGPGGSREVLQVAPVYAAAELAAVIPTATSRLLSQAGPLLFRMAPDDSVQGSFIASFADTALGARRLAIYHSPDEYGIGLAAGTAATARARGLSIVERSPVRLVQPCADPEGAAYYATLVEALKAAAIPDAVVLATRTQETACFTSALRREWPHIHVIAGDGTFFDSSLLRGLGGRGEGMHLVAFWHAEVASAASESFVRDFTRIAGRTPRHGEAMFTDGVMLVAQAIREGAKTRAAVLRYLGRVGSELPAFEGASGQISFAPGAVRNLWMTRLQGDSSVLVRTP